MYALIFTILLLFNITIVSNTPKLIFIYLCGYIVFATIYILLSIKQTKIINPKTKNHVYNQWSSYVFRRCKRL